MTVTMTVTITITVTMTVMTGSGSLRNTAGKRNYGRFPYFQSSNFQFECLKSEQIDCGCLFDTMSDFNFACVIPREKETRTNIHTLYLKGTK